MTQFCIAFYQSHLSTLICIPSRSHSNQPIFPCSISSMRRTWWSFRFWTWLADCYPPPPPPPPPCQDQHKWVKFNYCRGGGSGLVFRERDKTSFIPLCVLGWGEGGGGRGSEARVIFNHLVETKKCLSIFPEKDKRANGEENLQICAKIATLICTLPRETFVVLK